MITTIQPLLPLESFRRYQTINKCNCKLRVLYFIVVGTLNYPFKIVLFVYGQYEMGLSEMRTFLLYETVMRFISGRKPLNYLFVLPFHRIYRCICTNMCSLYVCVLCGRTKDWEEQCPCMHCIWPTKDIYNIFHVLYNGTICDWIAGNISKTVSRLLMSSYFLFGPILFLNDS